MSDTAAPTPPTIDDFDDEALVAAIKVAPPQIQMQVSLIAMTQEMRDRRAKDALTLPEN